MVSDRATLAYVCDVIVAPAARGQGLGSWLMTCIDTHPDLQGLRRWLLATRDAHQLYRKVGYAPLAEPARWLERLVEPSIAMEDPA
ncbi:MAG: GNAT family N-acetyltransferase [Candidatus Limnocylindrales bacterium]